MKQFVIIYGNSCGLDYKRISGNERLLAIHTQIVTHRWTLFRIYYELGGKMEDAREDTRIR